MLHITFGRKTQKTLLVCYIVILYILFAYIYYIYIFIYIYICICIYIYIYIYISYIRSLLFKLCTRELFLGSRYFKTGDIFERNIIKKIENIKSLDWKHRLPKIWILVENVKLWGSEPFENCYTTRVCYIKIDRKIVKKEKICLTYAMKHNFYTDPNIFYNDWETLSF